MYTDILHLIESFNLPSTEFTKLLHTFYKKYGKSLGRYGIEATEMDAHFIFDAAFQVILSDISQNHIKYNALRSLKIALSNDKTFRTIFEKLLSIFRYGIIHPNGNLRVESVRLLDEIEFIIYMNTQSLSNNKFTRKMKESNIYYWPLFLDLYFEIQRMHNIYEQERYDSLDYGDLRGRDEGYIPYSGDTKDKQLKAFRMALEVYNQTTLDEKLVEFGYIPEIREFDGDEKWQETQRKTKFPSSKEVEKSLQFFILLSGIPTTVDKVKDFIYNSPSDTRKASQDYSNFYLLLLERKNMEITQEALDIFQNCWNIFPHKSLGGKSPVDMI